jgi:hypothetical protein
LGLLLARSSQAQLPLYINSGATFYQGSDLLIHSTVQNKGTYVPFAGTLCVMGGDFINTGTINSTSASATLKMVEATAGTGHTLTLSGQAVPNLMLDVPAGTTLGSNGSVTGVVNLLSGHLFTSPSSSADYSLTLGAAGTLQGETNAHYLRGRVAQARNLSSNIVADFGNMGVTVNPANNSFPLTIERRAGIAQAGISYGVNPRMASFQGIDRIWAFSSTTLNSSATITLSWLPADDHGLTFTSTNTQVWRSDDYGTNWIKQGGVQDGSSRSVTVPITRLNAFYTVSTVTSPLPVELASFAAVKQGLNGLLTWQTASETNSDFFEPQASTDGTNWRNLGQVPAAGNSSSTRSYSFLDKSLARYAVPTVYYRLRSVDLDKSPHFSSVVSLRVEVPAWELTAYPNPFVRNLTAQLTTAEAGPVSLTLLDATGRVVARRTLAAQPGTQLITFEEDAGLVAGTYTLLVRQNNHKATLHLVKR